MPLERRPVSLFLRLRGRTRGPASPVSSTRAVNKPTYEHIIHACYSGYACNRSWILWVQSPLCSGSSQLVGTFPLQPAQCSSHVFSSTCMQHFLCLLLCRTLWTGSIKTHLCQCWLLLSEQKQSGSISQTSCCPVCARASSSAFAVPRQQARSAAALSLLCFPYHPTPPLILGNN